MLMKILASDYDGTLFVGGQIPPENRGAIARWRRAGNLFGVCTGRNKVMALQAVREQNIELDFVICCTGALILGADFNVIGQTYANCPDFVRFAAVVSAFRSERLWVTDNDSVYDIDTGLHLPGQIRPEDAGFIKRFHQCNTAFSDRENADKFIACLRSEFSQVLVAHVNCSCIDITAAGVGKAFGVSHYARLAGCAEENILTAGDNLNDIDMLSRFNGYAVSGSMPEAVNAAGKTAESIAEIIEMNI